MPEAVREKLRKSADSGSRRAILDLLKTEGPMDAKSLARRLEVSDMAARQHLYGLASEKLVTFNEAARPRGRPAKIWQLTEAANRFFPDGHQDLTLNLLNAVRAAFGESGMEKLIAARTAEQIRLYRDGLARSRGLAGQLAKLAALRTAEGYMAEVRAEDDGSFWFLENHCPICSAATACSGLCASELRVFREVLGANYSIERCEHIPAGARRCAYRICPRQR